MPHGSGIEYAVQKDERFRKYASSALDDAGRIFVIGSEMRNRVIKVFPELPGIEAKFTELHLGVDASLFEPVSRGERPKNIMELKTSIGTVNRGKTREQSDSLEPALLSPLDRAQLKSVFDEHARYDGKSPDADVEEKLDAIDWSRDPVLLFTGRIISPKGIQSVVAALPLILEQIPNLHLVIVGHGPLREPLEAWIGALRTGNRKLVENVVAWGRWLEGSVESDVPGDDLIEVTQLFSALRQNNRLDQYLESAQRLLRPDTVVFTGYLTHRELQFLFPSCDVGIFPSVVREAGPLVFLEALASGCFPLGTYFGGMAASIDSVSAGLPEEVGATMKLGLTNTVEDIVRQVPRALELGTKYKDALAKIARDRYDWVSVAQTLRRELYSLNDGTTNKR
jgi:glycosyltransferase involved in cell wall biosynthesis